MSAEPSTKRLRGHPRLFASADDLQKAVDSYWEWLEQHPIQGTDKRGNPCTLARPAFWGRLLLHIGAHNSKGQPSYESISPYVDGEYDDDDNRYSEVLARAKAACGAEIAEGGLAGQLDARMSQAALQNFHGWVDRTETTVTGSVLHRLEMPPTERIAAAAARLRGTPLTIEGEYEPVKSDSDSDI